MDKEFIVKCNVCGTRYYNWIGSTPCCGSIAYLVDNENEKTKDICLLASVDNEIKPIIIGL